MDIIFGNLRFVIENKKISLQRFGVDFSFAEVQVCGENKDTHMGAKMANSSEGCRLEYVSHTLTDHSLEILQKTPLVAVKTVLTAYDDTNAIRAYTEVKNISDKEIMNLVYDDYESDRRNVNRSESRHKNCIYRLFGYNFCT